MASDGQSGNEAFVPPPDGQKTRDDEASAIAATPPPARASLSESKPPALAAASTAPPPTPAATLSEPAPPEAAPPKPAPRKTALPKVELPRIALPKIAFPAMAPPRIDFVLDWLRALWRNLPRAWAGLAALAAILICAAPVLALLVSAASGQRPYMDASSIRLLSESIAGTLMLVVIGGGAATLLGAAAALLVTLCRFPGRDLFEWLLVLPIAAPVYALAFAYSSLTGPDGPVPYALAPHAGAAFVYAIGFFPLVYLAARASFANHAGSILEAARSMGAQPMRALLQVALPLAHPGIAAGAALAFMEIAADYGAAQHFGAATITTGLFRAWFSHGAPQLALQFGAMLVLGALLFLWLERGAREPQLQTARETARRPMPKYDMPMLPGVLATAFCTILVALGALVPLVWLARLALFRPFTDLFELGGPLLNSLILAGLGAGATLTLAIVVAAMARHGGSMGRAASLAAAASYAMPGAALALGVFALYAIGERLGWFAGLGTAVAIGLLAWTYAVRFAATGAQPVATGLERITAGMTGAARTLGAGRARRLFSVHLPIAAPGILAAALVVFIEALRELPATMLLRPYAFDTLAVRAFAYASDGRVAQSAAPALLLTAVGLVPLLFLSHQMTRAWTQR
jgi:iron(III) transport system permease protein